MYLKAYIQNLVKDGRMVSEKSQISYVKDLGPRSRNDLGLQYSHTFINSISCLHQPTFRSQAAIVSENSMFPLFPIKKSKLPNLNLP